MGDRNTLQNGGSVVTPRFGGPLHRELDALGPCVPGTDGFVRGRRWMSSGEEAPDTRRGLTWVKLRDEASLRRGKCSDQYMRNLYGTVQSALKRFRIFRIYSILNEYVHPSQMSELQQQCYESMKTVVLILRHLKWLGLAVMGT